MNQCDFGFWIADFGFWNQKEYAISSIRHEGTARGRGFGENCKSMHGALLRRNRLCLREVAVHWTPKTLDRQGFLTPPNHHSGIGMFRLSRSER